MTRIELPPHCDLEAARSLLPRLEQACAHGPVEVDGREVIRPGLALLQVLASARTHGDVHIVASSALADAAALAGLGELLLEGMHP